METFWFYIQLGLNHVLDFGAYDHILFLAALAAPFTFKGWKQILILATVFTGAHCTSLFLAVFQLAVVPVQIIEFLIPVTIAITALSNIFYHTTDRALTANWRLHIGATTFFGLIHGFGFSNYFTMLMAAEEEKLGPLFGFAAGIEVAQVLIIFFVLGIAFSAQSVFKIKKQALVLIFSILILLITIPLLIATFLW